MQREPKEMMRLIVKKRILWSLLFFCLLTLICGCIFDQEKKYCPGCQNNFYCSIDAPGNNDVKIELLGGDTLVYFLISRRTEGFPIDPVQFLDSYTLRISIHCNGDWLQGSDYVFSNEKNNTTYVNFEKTTAAKTDIFNEEQVTKCPDLAGYGVVEKKEPR